MAVNTMSAFVGASLASLALLSSVHVHAAGRVYQVDPAKSQVTIAVGKAGAFSFIAGHTHQIIGPIESGTVNVDPDDPSRSHVGLVISASALKVSAAGEPRDDPPKVQQAMESDKVLDVQRYPRMTFESTAVTLKRRDGAALDIVVTGQLTIRDVTRSITAPVHVQLAADGLVANGAFTIRQTAFGIKPISVGGVVAVKDGLDLVFSIAARP
jgi:polyisoprenoid-binding protein YceI